MTPTQPTPVKPLDILRLLSRISMQVSPDDMLALRELLDASRDNEDIAASAARDPRLVFIASPLSGDTERNQAYARICMLDSLKRGEAPYVPHLLYPQVLDDDVPEHREQGCTAALLWLEHACGRLLVYMDLGVSSGMKAEIALAEKLGIPVTYRALELGTFGWSRPMSDDEVDALLKERDKYKAQSAHGDQLHAKVCDELGCKDGESVWQAIGRLNREAREADPNAIGFTDVETGHEIQQHTNGLHEKIAKLEKDVAERVEKMKGLHCTIVGLGLDTTGLTVTEAATYHLGALCADVAHRDIKPETVAYYEDELDAARQTVKDLEVEHIARLRQLHDDRKGLLASWRISARSDAECVCGIANQRDKAEAERDAFQAERKRDAECIADALADDPRIWARGASEHVVTLVKAYALLQHEQDVEKHLAEGATAAVREHLAALEHEQWAHWTGYMLDTLRREVDDNYISSAASLGHGFEDLDCVSQWRRQIETPYEHLSDEEKDSDRAWADRALDILKAEREGVDQLDRIAGELCAKEGETTLEAATRVMDEYGADIEEHEEASRTFERQLARVAKQRDLSEGECEELHRLVEKSKQDYDALKEKACTMPNCSTDACLEFNDMWIKVGKGAMDALGPRDGEGLEAAAKRVVGERDALKDERDDPAGCEPYDAICKAIGAPDWEYPNQVVRDVEAYANKHAELQHEYEQLHRHHDELQAECNAQKASLLAHRQHSQRIRDIVGIEYAPLGDHEGIESALRRLLESTGGTPCSG